MEEYFVIGFKVAVPIATVISAFFMAKFAIKSQGLAIVALAESVKSLVEGLKIHETRLDEMDIWRAGSKGRQSECVVSTTDKFNTELKSMNKEIKKDSIAQWKQIDATKEKTTVGEHRTGVLEENFKKMDEKLDRIIAMIIEGKS